MKSHRLLVGLLALPAAAQSPLVPLPTRGMLPSLQIGLVFDNDPSLIVRKAAGLPAELHTFAGLGGQGVPQYTAAAIADWVAAIPASCPVLEIDAMSTGNDLLPLAYDPDSGAFRISQPAFSGWATLFLSMDDSPLFDRADVVGYYFDNPSFPSPLRESWYHELVRADYEGTSLVSLPPPLAGIAALDSAMGVIETTGGEKERGVIEVLDKLYFSLRPDSGVALGTALGQSGCDGATIFLATYDPSTGAVINVSVARTGAQLGLAPEDDIDALGVGKAPTQPPPLSGGQLALHPGELVFIFSTTPGSTFGELQNQLMVQAPEQGAWGVPGPVRTGPLHKSNGDPVVGAAGTLVGNVTGMCSKDPEVVDPSPASFGRASAAFDPFQAGLSLHARAVPPIHADATGTPVPVDSFQLTGVLSGWGSTGMPHDAFVYASARMPGSNVWIDLPYLLPLRTPTDGTFTFQVHVQFPWQFLSTTVARNEYEFQVTTFQLPAVAPFHVLQSPIMKMTRWN